MIQTRLIRMLLRAAVIIGVLVAAAVLDAQVSRTEYFVVGMVNQNGRYESPAQQITVGEAITRAGGLRENADADSITIRRIVDGKPVRRVVKRSEPVHDGDTIYVPPKKK